MHQILSATANKPPMKVQKHSKSVKFLIVASYINLKLPAL